jgi:hypothetical protein
MFMLIRYLKVIYPPKDIINIIDLKQKQIRLFHLSGDLVSTWTSDSGVFPEEMGTYHEGDILFLEEKRNGIIDLNYRWPGGIVYYRIDARFSKRTLYI